MTDRIERVRALYAAYASADRETVDAIFADGMHFTSPYDNRLDKAGFFEHCWSPPGVADFELVRTAVAGDTIVVTYETHGEGGVGRNTEALTFDADDRVVEVEVYFGWSLPHPVPEGEHRVE